MVRQTPAERFYAGSNPARTSNKMKLLRLLIIFIILGGLGAAVFFSDRFISSKAALSVVSDPSDQKVYLDGHELGTTPFLTEELEPGEETLNFGDFTEKITLTERALTVVNWVLGPAESFSAGEIVWFSSSSRGTELVVISTPEAEVFLDDESIGNSPLSRSIQAGVHSLEIKKDGYFSRTLKIDAREGYRLNASINLSLDPLSDGGSRMNAGGSKIKVMDLSTAESLLLADYELWVQGAAFWAERDDTKNYDYFLTAEGKIYDADGSQVSLSSFSKQSKEITLGYLGESGQSLSKTASATLSKMRAAVTPSTPKVKILTTGVGFLRVRSGPGTNYSEIGKAYPGEKYNYLGKQGSWFKIKFGNKEGWVSSQYAEKI